jgi:hypothetical protein
VGDHSFDLEKNSVPEKPLVFEKARELVRPFDEAKASELDIRLEILNKLLTENNLVPDRSFVPENMGVLVKPEEIASSFESKKTSETSNSSDCPKSPVKVHSSDF